MKALRNLLDNVKPNFEKGGKLAKFQSAFDAVETLFFVPNHTSQSGVHIHDPIDLKRTMVIVVKALLPALLIGIFNVGYQHFSLQSSAPGFSAIVEQFGFWNIFLFGLWQVLPIIIVSYVVGLTIEIIFAQIRGHSVNEGFFVSGMLIVLVMPPTAPLWQVAVSVAFAVIIGKEVFGGTGMNILNPALLARAFMFFAYPKSISGDKVWLVGDGSADAVTTATPLAKLAAGDAGIDTMNNIMWGLIPGSIGETSKIAILLGAVILLVTGIASWRIMLSTVLGGLFVGVLFNWFGSAENVFMQVPAWQQLLLGGFLFGMVFMATDPVTGTQTAKGKWIYGFLIGFFAILIRVVNPAYPEGMMLAILLMNCFAPLIDYYVVEGNIKRRLKRGKTPLATVS